MNTGGRRLRSLLVAAGIIGAAIPLASSPALSLSSQTSSQSTTAFARQSSSPLQITASERVTVDDPVPSRAYSAPFLLADPNNPNVIVASAVEMRSGICYLMRSTDAGLKWQTLPSVPALASYPNCFTVYGGNTQSPMAWGRNGTLYYGLLGYGQQDGGASRSSDISVLLARSTDLGNTWSTTLVDNARGLSGAATQNNGPLASIAVDSHSGSQDTVYVSWRQNLPDAKGAVSGPLVATSTDGGKTFSAPVNLNQFSTIKVTDSTGASFPVSFSTPHLAVNQDTGALYAVVGGSVPSAAKSPPPQPLYLATSTDHGKSFTVSPLTRPSPSLSEPIIQWSPAGGSQGTLLAVYEDKFNQTQGSEDIYFQRSTDAGKTWSTETRLNDDNPANQTYHYLPYMSVAANGRIDVAWFDFRNSNSFAEDVYYTYSTDNGATWAKNIRVTDQPIDMSLGINSNSDVRQPPGIASMNQYAAFGWPDTRLATAATETQDIYGNLVQFAPLPSGSSNTLNYLAAVFAGLAAAGVVILLLVAVRRSRAVEPRQTVGPEPAGAS